MPPSVAFLPPPPLIPRSALSHLLILELIDLRSEREQKRCSVCDLEACQPRISAGKGDCSTETYEMTSARVRVCSLHLKTDSFDYLLGKCWSSPDTQLDHVS